MKIFKPEHVSLTRRRGSIIEIIKPMVKIQYFSFNIFLQNCFKLAGNWKTIFGTTKMVHLHRDFDVTIIITYSNLKDIISEFVRDKKNKKLFLNVNLQLELLPCEGYLYA